MYTKSKSHQDFTFKFGFEMYMDCVRVTQRPFSNIAPIKLQTDYFDHRTFDLATYILSNSPLLTLYYLLVYRF